MGDVRRLIASGRDGDIYEYGPGLVLRRSKHGRVIEPEARAMLYAAEQGYPVPHVREVRAGGTEILMERLEGPMMMDVLARRPHTIGHHARLLADLHDRLHQIPGPDWLPGLGAGGGRLLHLDLHPMNVMMTKRGPVVIDWANAARGDPLLDVGMTYVLLTCPRMPLPSLLRASLQPLRVAMARLFVHRYRGPELDRWTAEAAQLKALDSNLFPDEVRRCERLAVRLMAR